MKTATLKLPTMYGDHHVVEVRRLLSALPGIEDIYASSSFQIVEVSYDPAKSSLDDIKSTLSKAGYSGQIPVAVESGTGDRSNGSKNYFRHTAAYEQTGNTVGFSQKTPYAGRPLWPCPGMGPIKRIDEEATDG